MDGSVEQQLPGENHAVLDRPGAPGLRITETHISVLVFAADRVYKIRKPVRFGFLDFTNREEREADCYREVLLNRRLAPDVYLGVADLVMDGTALDHMVVMRALPEARQLAHLVRNGSDPGPYLDATAQTLAAFHAGANRSAEISASASSAAFQTKWTDNHKEMKQFVGAVVDPDVEHDIQSLVRRWLGTHSNLLAERIAGGHICDGHGDLQASDIFCLDDGVRILDCLEFSNALRYDDVCGDVGFLAMDLERLGRPKAAQQFVRAYEKHAGTRLPPTLLHFHIALRSYIRAIVACIAVGQGSKTDADSARELHLNARRHLLQTRRALVLVGGLPGSGKTTLAKSLEEELEWVVLSSDAVRPDLALGPNRYASHAIEAVYAELFRQARDQLRRGRSVILDASWISADEREKAAIVASQMKADFIELQCTCPGGVATERIRHRLEQGKDDSEATVSVRKMMGTEMDPWPSGVLIDTTVSRSKAVEKAFAALAAA
jgi:uncharacterized protein